MSGARWMAEIFYNDGSETDIVAFDELRELQDIVERGPNWNTIERTSAFCIVCEALPPV